MFTNAFAGSTKKPTDAQLTATLGPSRPVWDQLLTDLAEQHGISGHEWKSYSSKARWSCRVTRKGRTVANSKSHPGSRRKSQARPPAKEPADLEPSPSHAVDVLEPTPRLCFVDVIHSIELVSRETYGMAMTGAMPMPRDTTQTNVNARAFALTKSSPPSVPVCRAGK
jgi:hypothetical protein